MYCWFLLKWLALTSTGDANDWRALVKREFFIRLGLLLRGFWERAQRSSAPQSTGRPGRVPPRKLEAQAWQEAELRSTIAEDFCITLRNEMIGLDAQVQELRWQENTGAASENLCRQVESLQAAALDSWAQERTSLQTQASHEPRISAQAG